MRPRPRGAAPVKKTAAKLADVARLARVSTATVSRALSSPERVSRETRDRIGEVVRRLGYVAHGAARALASRRTTTVGAVIPTLDNAIFANTTHALQKTLDEAGYTLLLACHEFDADAELRITRKLIEHGIDGLVLVGTTHRPELFELIDAVALPYVLTWALDDTGRHPCVGFNNRTAAQRLANYLLDLGHRDFAVIAGITANNERAAERIEGVRTALAARGVSLPERRVVEKPYSLVSGRDGLREVMSGGKRPTAILCGNDVLAIGAMAECRSAGLRIPADVSITGFDDMEIASLMSPGLTTVHLPTEELGRYAASHLLARLGDCSFAWSNELPVEMIVRGTTAPPRRTGRHRTRDTS